MKEHPILFNSEMVRALLEGRKTQTRRVIKPQPRFLDGRWFWTTSKHSSMGIPEPPNEIALLECPYGKVGDRLWVRETFQVHQWPSIASMGSKCVGDNVVYYKASVDDKWVNWKPSIHMPRWASRITLEVVSVRVERVQEILCTDALLEGAPKVAGLNPHVWFRNLWDSINVKRGFRWDKNPWVWVVEFKRVEI